MSRKIKKLINLIEKCIRKLYHKLPISSSFKIKAKNCFFTVFGCFMKNTPSYIIWKQTRVKKTKKKKSINYEEFINVEMNKRIAVQLHLFYLDLIDEFVLYLGNIPYKFDVLLSVVDDSKNVEISEKIKTIENVEKVIIKKVENRGRDVAPLLVYFANEIADYDYVCHVHSKKSLYTGREQTGWRKYLLDGLMGDKNQVYRSFYYFESDPEIALIYPESYPEITYMAHTWMSNRKSRELLMNRLGYHDVKYPMFVDFPLGTMFWGRVSVLMPFLKANFKITDFPEEAGQKDGTIAHAFERCLGALVKMQGYKVAVYDDETDDFTIGYGRKNLNQYWEKSAERLVMEADRYDVVSFDIFDTLLMRKAVNPDDLFDITKEYLKSKKNIDIDYRKLRKKAEKNLRKSGRKSDYTINDIYEELMKISGFSQEKCEIIKSAEVDIERKFLIPRKEIVGAMNAIKNTLHKKVVLVSDMYLTSKELEPILRENGITEYDELWISSEKQARKEDGSMWKIFLDTFKGKEIMHVGDNELSDTQIPGDMGIYVHHVLSAKELFNLTNAGRVYRKCQHTYVDSIAMGLLLEKKLNSPYALNSQRFEMKIDSSFDFGYCFIGPVVCDYMSWAVRRAKEQGIKQILFLAREGYLFEKIFDIMKQNFQELSEISGKYLYTSRRSSMVASLKDESDIREALNVYYEGSLKGLLAGRFGIDMSETSETADMVNIISEDFAEKDMAIALPGDAVRVYGIIERFNENILNKASQERDSYLKYIKDNIKIEKSALFDIGYSGSIQYYLSKIMDVAHAGFYFATDGKKIPMKIQGSSMEARYIENDLIAPASTSSIHRYSLLLEAVLTSMDAQFIYMGDNGPVFAKDDKSDEYKKLLDDIHEGAINFAKDFYSLVSSTMSFTDIICNKDVYEELIRMAVEEDIIDEGLKKQFVMEDNFCTDEDINVFEKLSKLIPEK